MTSAAGTGGLHASFCTANEAAFAGAVAVGEEPKQPLDPRPGPAQVLAAYRVPQCLPSCLELMIVFHDPLAPENTLRLAAEVLPGTGEFWPVASEVPAEKRVATTGVPGRRARSVLSMAISRTGPSQIRGRVLVDASLRPVADLQPGAQSLVARDLGSSSNFVEGPH